MSAPDQLLNNTYDFAWCDSVRTKLEKKDTNEREYGVKKRKSQRRRLRIKNEHIILLKLAERDPEAGSGGKNHQVTSEVVEKLLGCAEALECSANYIIDAINFVRKLVIHGNNNHGWNVAVPSPAIKLRNYQNPISTDSFAKLDAISKELKSFENFLLEMDLSSTTSQDQFNRHEPSFIWGITLYALVYFSACLDKTILLSLMRGGWKIERYDLVWIDVAAGEDANSRLCRIFPDAISMFFLQRINQNGWFPTFEKNKNMSSWLEKSISLVRHKLKSKFAGGYNEWGSCLALWHQMYLPAQFVALAKAKQKTTAFAPQVWHRILLQKPIYRESTQSESHEFQVDIGYAIDLDAIKPKTIITKAAIYEQLKKILAPKVKKNNCNSVAPKKAALDKLKEFSEKLDHQPNITNAVVYWLIYKFDVSKIKVSSAYQYLTTFCTYLFDHFDDADIANMDDESYESIYTAIINAVSSDNSKQAKMQLIVQFHRFLMLNFQATSINFDALPEFNGDVGAKAHIVTEREYAKAKTIIQSNSSPYHTPAYFIMMLCYRCGLRIGEATHLLLDDIHYPSRENLFTECAITLKVRPNQFHTIKTPNAERQLPLHLLLDANELIEFKTFIADQTDVKSGASALLFHDVSGLNKPINSNEVCKVIVRTLRYITLDNGITIHQLRHSFCCLLFQMVFFNTEVTPLPKHWLSGNHPVDGCLKSILFRHTQNSRRPIYQIGEWMGHSDPTMSLSAYMHWGHLPIRNYLDQHLNKDPHRNALFKKIICKLVGITEENLKTKLQKKHLNLNDTVASILDVTRLKKTQPYQKKQEFIFHSSGILLSNFSLNHWIIYFKVFRKLQDIQKTENFLGIEPGQTVKPLESLRSMSRNASISDGGYRLFPIPDNPKKFSQDLIKIYKDLHIILPTPPEGIEEPTAQLVYKWLQKEFQSKPDFIKRLVNYILKEYRYDESKIQLNNSETAIDVKLFLDKLTVPNVTIVFDDYEDRTSTGKKSISGWISVKNNQDVGSYGFKYALTMFALRNNIIE